MKKLLIALLMASSAYAQTSPKNIPGRKTSQKVTIDGKIDELAWKDAARFDEMVEFRPVMGRKEEFGNHTEAYLMYDDEGIYFGGICHERNVDSVSRELTGRDGFGTNDYIGIIFDTYKDKLNGFEYFVTPLGEQWDAKMTSAQNSNNGGEDFSWNAVWKSKVILHNKGWTFEIFLPYSAIRFSKDKIQDWGINITRRKRKTEQQYTWNPIDINVNGFLTQEGFWTGITDIKPPLRLQLFPYFSVYQNHFPSSDPKIKSWTNQYSGGLDLKLGISQSFTLDATLIPDFGQVQSDNRVLNLTPFEVKFNEYRNFFTEGTELFNKGDLFYSRRIGGSPIYAGKVYDELKNNEEVINNPSESKLINASKISGRTQGGLGIGILNAITHAQHAEIRNTETGEIRQVETDPATNYSIVVLDQNLKNNSSVTFFNSNVTRAGSAYDANLSVAMFSIFDKKNTYFITGKSGVSKLKYIDENKLGYGHSFGIGKSSGRFLFQYNQELTDTKFSNNDLGYFTNNNFIDHGVYVGYRYTKPKKFYNRLHYNMNLSLSTLFSPIGAIESTYQNSRIQTSIVTQTKKLFWLGLVNDFMPKQHDFYEPRIEGKYFERGSSALIGIFTEGNSAKKYYLSSEIFLRKYFNFYNQTALDASVNQTYRFNPKFSVSHNLSYQPRFNGVGFATNLDGQSLFALRDVKTFENILFLKYNFTNKMGMTFRTRHYNSRVNNRQFYNLKSDGELALHHSLSENYNRNVNFFNIDMVYTWQFAPGSFLNFVWKDAAFAQDSISDLTYGKNLRNTLNGDQNNNISLKVIYFLDYLTMKNWIRKG
ncbi:MAG: carbohydrate binding family 9 domain-containing protein [Cytophagaceae bacterium]|nr:carbohydrate binding family 9 domain-containing protein [Cytophagaceae bacterium]